MTAQRGDFGRSPGAAGTGHNRYAQCDDTCTTDCGACKGVGGPAVPDLMGNLQRSLGLPERPAAPVPHAEPTDGLRQDAPAQVGDDQLYLDSIRTEKGETVITAHGAEQTLALMALSMRTFFEANSDNDTNYVQSGVLHERKTWNFVVYPAGKPTPHDLRRRAEAERDALLAKLQAVEALATEMDGELGDYGYAVRNGLKPGPGERIRRALAGQHTTDEESDRG